jgi:nitroreductase/dihydropteridine reductase
MSLVTLSQTRYTTKAYDAARKIPQAQVEELITLLRNSPSSVNSQPWHFVVASTDEGKAQVARGAQGGFAYNEPKILNASHVVVLCARTDLSEDYLEALLDQEEHDGRFAAEGARANQRKSRQGYVDIHRYQTKDLPHWMEKQVYLSLGTLLLGAAMLGIDATPMEGIDTKALDEALGLRERGFTAVVACALGYHADSDFNARLPKSRLAEAVTLTRI